MLQDGQQVPVGSTFDTSKGRVNLSAAGNAARLVLPGRLQARPDQGREAAQHAHAHRQAQLRRRPGERAAKKKKRRLWGDGKGKFRTQGEFSSATVRGTRWLTEDRCNGTLTRVTKGRVAVRDFARSGR